MLADTSSAPAAGKLETGPNAAELAELIDDPIFARSDAAAATYSGDAFTNDIQTSRLDHEGQAIAQSPTADWTRAILPDFRWPFRQLF
jgi:hypothetical protein